MDVWSREGQHTAHEQIISRLSLIVKVLVPILAGARIRVGRTCSTSSPSVGKVQAAAAGVERLPESIVTNVHPETRARGLK